MLPEFCFVLWSGSGRETGWRQLLLEISHVSLKKKAHHPVTLSAKPVPANALHITHLSLHHIHK